MICQKCHEKPAVVFMSSIINGKETTMYLCNDCAKSYPLLNFSFEEPFSMKDIMNKFKLDEDTPTDKENTDILAIDNTPKEEDIECPNCRSTYFEYKKTGKVGCSKCYEAFKEKLKPIFKNRYGNEEYIGKIPKKSKSDIYINNEIRILKEDLNRAVENEEYETAANIRDKIKSLEECNE